VLIPLALLLLLLSGYRRVVVLGLLLVNLSFLALHFFLSFLLLASPLFTLALGRFSKIKMAIRANNKLGIT
jgi:hypothetical protein